MGQLCVGLRNKFVLNPYVLKVLSSSSLDLYNANTVPLMTCKVNLNCIGYVLQAKPSITQRLIKNELTRDYISR